MKKKLKLLYMGVETLEDEHFKDGLVKLDGFAHYCLEDADI